MPCEWLKGPNGENIHINYGRGNRGKLMKCKFCNYNYHQNEEALRLPYKRREDLRRGDVPLVRCQTRSPAD